MNAGLKAYLANKKAKGTSKAAKPAMAKAPAKKKKRLMISKKGKPVATKKMKKLMGFK